MTEISCNKSSRKDPKQGLANKWTEKRRGIGREVLRKPNRFREPNVCRKLRLQQVKRIRRIQFLLIEYSFFKDSEEGSALPLSLPWFLSPLSLTLHIVKSRAFVLFNLPCYFAKLGTKIVGLFAIQEHCESLFVASLGVAKNYRRLGIGACLLGYIETIAKDMGKRLLEVEVLRKNIPAIRLYTKCGFTFIQKEGVHYTMRGKKPL